MPGRLLTAGFRFQFPDLRAALEDLQNQASVSTNPS
ncbi:MAG: DUF1731 domain-containing protein [Verrucomicrobiota bacterium]